MRPRSLLLLLSLLAITLAGCATAPAAAELPTALPTQTIPPPTATLAPTVTILSPTPTPLMPYLGALSPDQRARLDTIARSFISLTPEEALLTAQNLNYIGRNANPATMCGPLSLAILQQAGLVDPSVPLADFWYLNPREGYGEKFLQTVFPAQRFEKIEQNLPVDEIDYATAPLYPGDFLYLFAGDSGSFEHMLVVSRVDDAGRAYAVTNVNTESGVIVAEVMLYDPAHAGSGQFYEWTDWKNRYIGRTGYGGFWLWRPLAEDESPLKD